MYLLRSLSSKGVSMIVLNIGVFLLIVAVSFVAGLIVGAMDKSKNKNKKH